MQSSMAFVDYEPNSCKEIYSAINRRQIEALMFHDQMAALFSFLGLKGFKCMHEYQYMAESLEHRKIQNYYTEHHDKLICDEELNNPDIIPDDWYKHDRWDVTPSLRKQYVQRAMQWYKDWEDTTKTLYEKCAAALMSWGNTADFIMVKRLVCDVDKELKCLNALILELSATDYDIGQIMSYQHEYYYHYKERLEKVGSEE